MKKQGFSRTPLAAGVALALGATAPATVFAQDSYDNPVEEIIVTGIRGSLKASMDIKRSADGVVDAINAEDMGDFPDTNLAESLQRITGVSIDRQRGEGSRVTVRGFGPDFNLVLLNGRQMPTTSGVGRSFDFGNLASEGIASVEIYKSGKADVPTGGIGSTINIQTTRPLDAPGLRATVAASGVYDNSRTKTSDTDWTGEVSGLFSNTFADDKVGVSLTAIRQERESGGATASVGGWRTFTGLTNNCWGCGLGPEEWGGIPFNDQQVNRPGDGDLYSVPQSIGYELANYDRVRTNGQLTLQLRPVEEVTATLDYTYSELELDRTYNNLSAWFNFDQQETAWTDGPQASPTEYTENIGGSDFSMGAGLDAFRNENKSLGLNLLWDVSDRLALELDYHDSSAENSPNSRFGNSALLSIAAYTRNRTSGYFGQDLPVLELGLSDPLSPDDMTITGSVFAHDRSRMEIQQLRAGGTLNFDTNFVESIDFGIQLTDVDNRAATAVVQRDSWSAQTPLGAIADLMEPASISGAFSELAGSSDSRLQTDYYTFSMADLIERAESLMDQGVMPIAVPGNGDLGPCGTALCASSNFNPDRRTLEESQAAYAQVNMATEWGDKPVSMRLGLRYEQTDVTSEALVPAYSGLNWVAGNELSPISTGTSFTELEGDYDHWLPNFDFRIDMTDNLVGRVSLSKTLTRPNYVDIQGGLTIASPVRITEGSGARGNPALLPFESDNLDLSLEYYYGEGSYAAAGYFRKDVTNFIGTASVTETAFDLPHPALGPLGDQARAATGASDGGTLYAWILANLPDEEGVDEVNGIISGVAGRDPSTPFNLTIPVNIEKATMDGWELVVQHNFGDSGFGVIANATIVDADVGYDNLSLAQQFVLTGLSDSANFIGFYDKNGIGIRIAYNWRDEFLAGTGQNNVGAGPPTYVDEYQQWDLSASYWYNDNLQFFVDVLNLTDETSYVFGRDNDQTLFATQLGTRYNVGLRYKF